MRHYLVLAHQTLDSPQLLEAIRDRMSDGPATFHLVVPERHDQGAFWNEGQVRLEAERRLEETRLRLLGLGIAVTGEVGHTNPVQSVNNALRREPKDHYDEIIISMLPSRVSKWFGMDAPSRIQKLTKVPVSSVTAVAVPA
jgi:hypothetical protein